MAISKEFEILRMLIEAVHGDHGINALIAYYVEPFPVQNQCYGFRYMRVRKGLTNAEACDIAI
jgi:hypothetical protein